MSIQAIKNGIVSGISGACNSVKNFATWGGRTVHAGYSNYLVPTVSSIWTAFANSVKSICNFLRTGPGIGFAAAAGLVAFGISALKISQSPDYAASEHQISQSAWRAIGIASLAGAAVSASASVALLVL